MPAQFTAILSSGCQSTGGGFITVESLLLREGGTNFSYHITGPLGYAVDGDFTYAQLPFTISDLPNGLLTAEVTNNDTSASSSEEVDINCEAPDPGSTCDLQLSVTWQSTGDGPQAIISFASSAGDGYGQHSNYDPPIPEVAFVPSPVYQLVDAGSTVTFFIRDRAGCLKSVTTTAPIYGCTSPDADNYNPLATQEDGSCTISPRMSQAAALPGLGLIGIPLWASIRSITRAAVTAGTEIPRAAYAEVDVSQLGATPGVVLTINGYIFRSGYISGPENFNDADTLAEALRSCQPLAADYLIEQPGDNEVRLTSRVEGTPGNLIVSSSDETKLIVGASNGIDRYWSQRRQQWGCYLEVWAGCGTSYLGTTNKSVAVLAQRFEMDYRADNSYQFDIADALQQYTGHAYPKADGTCPDRLVSYFVRFGEVYADTLTGRRRVRTSYESPVQWALEAVEVVPFANEHANGTLLLTARPTPWRIYPGGNVLPSYLVPAEHLGATPTNGFPAYHYAGFAMLVRTFDHAQRTDSYAVPLEAPNGGSMRPTPEQSQLCWQLGARPDPRTGFSLPLTGSFEASVSQAGSTLLFTTPLEFLPLSSTAPALSFVNRQGGVDTFWFEGEPEEETKRTVSTYATTNATALRQAEVTLPTRLVSGLIPKAVWDWLRRELGTSPTAWLETSAGPVPVLLTSLTAESDPVKHEYSLSVAYETAPLRGLSN